MSKRSNRIFVSLVVFLLLATGLVAGAIAQESPSFIPGNLVVSVEGCGVQGGTCTSVPNGTGGTGANPGTSSVGGYGDNQASPLTLFQYQPTGVSSATFINSLALPQTGSGANSPVSAEYGSSSEATVQLSGPGQYLTIMGYGVNANAFNANSNAYSAAPNAALAQSGSLTGQGYTPIPRVVTLIDPYGNVNSSTALYNIFDTNNPRSAYTADGLSSVYVSGQGTGCDLTGGVFLSALGSTNNAPTPITGGDASPTNSCLASGYTGSVVAEDTRTVQIYNSTLYISVDSTEGKSDNRSYLGTLGSPPATSAYVPAAGTFPSGYTDGPSQISGIGNSGGTGKETLNAATANGVNSSGLQVNLSPENYFFASPSVLYLADSGSPKQSSANSLLGAGGLQKWVNSKSNGSGTWTWEYTLYKGLNLVANSSANSSNTSGTTGLLGLTGTVVSGTAYLYATNYTIADLDPSYIYGISDVVSATTNPGTTFTQLAAAPPDSNFKGISLTPTLPAGSATITSSPSGLAFTSTDTGCAPGTYTTPVTLIWTSGHPCQLSVVSPQTVAGTQYVFNQWQDGTTATADSVTAPTTSSVYTASFQTVPTVTWPAASAITYGQTLTSSSLTGGSASVSGSFAFTTPSTVPAVGISAQSVTFTPSNTTAYTTVTGTVNVTAVEAPAASLSTSSVVTGSNAAGYTGTITVTNTGAGTVTGLTLNSATLGAGAGSPLPQTFGTLASGASTSFSVSFPGSVGVDGAKVSEKYSGTVNGGTYSASVRSVTLP
jgi:hypothetical protein